MCLQLQERTDARTNAGVKLIDAILPLIMLGLFYDKSMMSDKSSKYGCPIFGCLQP